MKALTQFSFVVLTCAGMCTAVAQPPGPPGDREGRGGRPDADRGQRSPVERLMRLDKDEDGKLTEEEVGDSRLKSLLTRADKDKDGIVTREELETMVGSRERGDRGPRGDGDRGPRGDGDRGPRGDGDRGPRGDGDRGPRGDGDRGPRGSSGEGRGPEDGARRGPMDADGDRVHHAATVSVGLVVKVVVNADQEPASVVHPAMATCKVVVVPADLHKRARYCHRSFKNTWG